MTNTIQPQVNGPLKVEGDVEVFGFDGASIRKDSQMIPMYRSCQSVFLTCKTTSICAPEVGRLGSERTTAVQHARPHEGLQ